ncbi:MAG: hypothetical protein GC189_05860 [Alphaproteobacteria bacterium]|nr:hypothetical protein [Alphaproteobacteria bacterium]
MPQRAPALFIGHGSPMNAIDDTPSARGYASGAALPHPIDVDVLEDGHVFDRSAFPGASMTSRAFGLPS